MAFETGRAMRICAQERRSRRSSTMRDSRAEPVLRGWRSGTEERSSRRSGKPGWRARGSHLRTVFSQTRKAAAVARSEAPEAVSWAIIFARVSGVRVALACMFSVREGVGLSVHPPPACQTPAVRTTS